MPEAQDFQRYRECEKLCKENGFLIEVHGLWFKLIPVNILTGAYRGETVLETQSINAIESYLKGYADAKAGK